MERAVPPIRAVDTTSIDCGFAIISHSFHTSPLLRGDEPLLTYGQTRILFHDRDSEEDANQGSFISQYNSAAHKIAFQSRWRLHMQSFTLWCNVE